MLELNRVPVAAVLCTAKLANRYMGLCRSDGVACEPTS